MTRETVGDVLVYLERKVRKRTLVDGCTAGGRSASITNHITDKFNRCKSIIFFDSKHIRSFKLITYNHDSKVVISITEYAAPMYLLLQH